MGHVSKADLDVLRIRLQGAKDILRLNRLQLQKLPPSDIIHVMVDSEPPNPKDLCRYADENKITVKLYLDFIKKQEKGLELLLSVLDQ